MKALRFHRSIPRYVLLKLLGPRFPQLFSSSLPPVRLRDIPESKLPGDKWVRVAPVLAGICGSDLATICAKGSPYLAPVTSMPFVLGHEVVGRIIEVGERVKRCKVGDRVVLHPALGCTVRGIDPPCNACGDGCDALCRNLTRGDISAGVQTGYCRDTGGGFSENFVAHESQAYSVPENMPDSVAVLVEPFACAMHAALKATLSRHDTAMVIGCGSIGLLLIAALRATKCEARIVAVAKYGHQQRLAKELGADEVLPVDRGVSEQYERWAQSLNAEVLAPELGKPTVMGGASATFDCIGSSRSIDDGIRFTKSGGDFVLVGMPGIPKGIDWTAIWHKELTLRAAYAYGPEETPEGRRDTFELAIEMLTQSGDRMAGLVGEPYKLSDYRKAIWAALNTGKTGAAKTVFAIP